MDKLFILQEAVLVFAFVGAIVTRGWSNYSSLRIGVQIFALVGYIVTRRWKSIHPLVEELKNLLWLVKLSQGDGQIIHPLEEGSKYLDKEGLPEYFVHHFHFQSISKGLDE